MAIKNCGLIGRTLKHSYSPQIHKHLNEYLPDDKKYTYNLIELEPDDIESFLRSKDFHAINVTIPYKQTVIPFCSKLSETAKKVGCVNTITKLSDGSLFGDNTDYYGFSYMLNTAGIEVAGKKVLILGSGGSSLTSQAVAADRYAKEIIIISRSGENNYDNISNHSDADIIINTTPVGMYPNTGVSPVNLSMFPKLSGVADIIYNPAKTQLLLDAEKRNIPYVNGLSMLVAQAKLASEKFVDCEIEVSAIGKITSALENQMKNIILTGMPGCGKTSVGMMIAEKTGRNFIDTDDMIIKSAGKSIPDIFSESGEEIFRQYETEAINEVGKLSSQVIATGGGIITRERNIDPLRQNSIVFFLNRDVEALPIDGRPLSKNTDAVKKLYIERLPLYRKYSDYEINVSGSIDETAQKILNLLLI